MKKQITHKELLTFSNLTNLEWQFVNLNTDDKIQQDKTEDSKSGINNKKSTILKELLDPENFIRENEEGNFEKYVYMEDLKERIEEIDDYKLIDKAVEKGLQKMRKASGIGMEYLEHSYTGKDKDERMTTEGSFLNDWEVIYGADNYKVVADYLDYLYSKQPEKLKKSSNSKNEFMNTTKESAISFNPEKEEENKRYPTREEVEKMTKAIETIKVVMSIIKTTSNVVIPTFIGVKHADEILDLQKVVTVENKTELFKQSYEKILKKSINLEGVSLNDLEKLGGGSKGIELLSNKLIGKGLTKIIEKRQLEKEEITEKDLEEIENSGKNPEIQLTKSLDMKNTGFRVIVLKNEKKKKIVIAYNGGKSDGKNILPKERDLLQLVYDKICRENKIKKDSGYEIKFTGINNGADLGFIRIVIYMI